MALTTALTKSLKRTRKLLSYDICQKNDDCDCLSCFVSDDDIIDMLNDNSYVSYANFDTTGKTELRYDIWQAASDLILMYASTLISQYDVELSDATKLYRSQKHAMHMKQSDAYLQNAQIKSFEFFRTDLAIGIGTNRTMVF